MSNISLPALTTDDGFAEYLRQIKSIPSLTQSEETDLAVKFQEEKDIKAAQTLVASHLKLVAKIAFGFKGYGLSVVELVSEGNLGLMHAVKKFNPKLGHRLSTYATWWIKAYIQEYILKSWSLVKIGTTVAQKKLFFNLGRLKKKILGMDSKHLSNDQVKVIAQELEVTESEVIEMDKRLSGSDLSLNNLINSEDEDSEMINILPEVRPNQEQILSAKQEYELRKNLLFSAMKTLSEREQDIIKARKLSENPATLEDLSIEYNISRERIRQIEARAFEKIQNYILNHVKALPKN